MQTRFKDGLILVGLFTSLLFGSVAHATMPKDYDCNTGIDQESIDLLRTSVARATLELRLGPPMDEIHEDTQEVEEGTYVITDRV